MTIAKTLLANNVRSTGYLSVQSFGATGDGATDDRAAIQSALAAAVTLGCDVFFPPGTYMVGRAGSNNYCLIIPGSNLRIFGVPGASTIKQVAGLPDVGGIVAIFADQRSNVVFENLTLDGNWGNAATSIAPASNGVALPTATINVRSTSGFPTSGTMTVVLSDGTSQVITYTNVTATQFTGCTGGTGTMAQGNPVGYVDDNTGINQTTQVDPKNHLLMLRGCINVEVKHCTFQQSYGDMIWVGYSSTDSTKWSYDIRVMNCDGNMSARNGMTLGQACSVIRCENTNFLNIFAQAFDTEPPLQPCRDVLIRGCYLDTWWNPSNGARTGNSPLSIQGGSITAGTQALFSRKYRVIDTTIRGSIIISAAYDVQVRGCRILCDWTGMSSSPVFITGIVDDIEIVDNEIYDMTTGAGSSNDAAISVQYYGSGNNNFQPANVLVARNQIHARNGRHGVKVEGTGGGAYSSTGTIGPETGTASAIGATTLTDGTKSWTVNQWAGFTVRRGSVVGCVISNTATQLTLMQQFPSSSGWYTPLGDVAPTPATGAYVISAPQGVVDIAENIIDCSNDGNGQGGLGIYINATRAGMRVRARDNKIQNATTAGIRVTSYDAARPIVELDLLDNVAYDNQAVATCLETILFDSNLFYTKMMMRGNEAGAGVAANVSGLTSGVWLVSDGYPQQWAGYGSPNGVITADIGALFQRRDSGGARPVWGKQSFDGSNVGWVGFGTPSAPAWTVDAGSGIGIPQNSTEWQALIDAAGLTGSVNPPDFLWPCQESSGDLVDVTSGVNLIASGAGLTYQQPVSGWESKSAKTADNQSGNWQSTSASLPDLGVGAMTAVFYAVIDSNFNNARSLHSGGATSSQTYIGGGTATFVVSGVNSNHASGTEYGAVRPYGWVHDTPGNSVFGFEDLDKLTVTRSAAVTGKRFTVGTVGGAVASPTARRLYGFGWASAISSTILKRLLQTAGWYIAWS